MPLTLVTGPANAEKARVALDAYRAWAPRDPILVVPTPADVEHYRRELAGDGLVFGTEVLTFNWLVREIGRRAGSRGRAAGRLTRERAAASAVATTTLDRLAAAAATPGFPRALRDLAEELAESRIDPPRLIQALREAAGGDPARRAYGEEVGHLYAAYRGRLEAMRRPDPQLTTRAALDALRNDPAAWGPTPVVLYGFDDLQPLQRDAIDTLANHAGADVLFTLTYELGREALKARASTEQELIALGATVERLDPRAEHYEERSRAALHHLERSLFVAGAAKVKAGAAVALLEGGGQRAEAELVAGQVAALLAAGHRPDDVAVVHRALPSAAALLSQVFAAYDIPVALDRRVLAGHTALGRGLCALLRCAVLDGSADDLLTWLRTPGLLEVPALADWLEGEVRREGLRSAAEARAVWEAQRWPLDTLDQVTAAARRGMAELCERLAGEAGVLLAGPWARDAPVLTGPAADDARVAARLRGALRELAKLPEELLPQARELASTIEELGVHLGEAPGPGRVTVATPLEVRARRVRVLFVMGMQEGVFPAPARPEPFFSEDERVAINVATGLGLPLAGDALEAERYLFYVAASRPTERLVLSWHAADDEGRPAVRSLFVDDLVDLFKGPLTVERRELGAAGWAHGAPTTREAARAAAASALPAPGPPIAPLSDPRVLEQLGRRGTWSASSLELWTDCPVKWFVERGLDPEGLVPDPEPMVRGALAHRVLEQAFGELSRDGAALTPDRLPEARALLHEALAEHAASYKISVNAQRLRSAIRRLEVDLIAYLDHAARSGTSFVPSEFELRFGLADDPHPAVELFDGELCLAGRIDRLDRGPDGTQVLVYDYKGKSAPPHAKWGPPAPPTEDEPKADKREGKLQIALYMLAVEHLLKVDAVGGLYQPLGADDPVARGVVRDDADLGLGVKKNDRADAEEVRAILDRCAAAALDAVREIRAGRLEPRPATCGWRDGGCTYPSICRCPEAAR